MKNFELTEDHFTDRGWVKIGYDQEVGPNPPLAFMHHQHAGHKFEIFYRGNGVFDLRELTHKDSIPAEMPISDMKWYSLDYKVPMWNVTDLENTMRAAGIPIHAKRHRFAVNNPYGPEQVILQVMKDALMDYLGVKPMIIGISRTMPGAGFRFSSFDPTAGWSDEKRKQMIDELNKKSDINKNDLKAQKEPECRDQREETINYVYQECMRIVKMIDSLRTPAGEETLHKGPAW